MSLGLAAYLAERAARYEFAAADARRDGNVRYADTLERLASVYKTGARQAFVGAGSGVS